jgi:chromosome segregation ATPase
LEVAIREAINVSYGIPADTAERMVREMLAKVEPAAKAATGQQERRMESNRGDPEMLSDEPPADPPSTDEVETEADSVQKRQATQDHREEELARSRTAWDVELRKCQDDIKRLTKEVDARTAEVRDLEGKLERLEKAAVRPTRWKNACQMSRGTPSKRSLQSRKRNTA